MKQINSYRDLDVWQKAIDLAVRSWQVIRSMPKIEQYSSGDQLIKSSSSIAANIAEGYGRYSRAEYLRFLAIANGSRCEFEARLEIYLRAKLVMPEIAQELRRESESIGQMLTRLRQRLRSSS